MTELNMKYSTSPPMSRCTSPMSVRSSSSLPMPATCRQECFGAPTKCYKYLRKLLKFDQMDFEFASWQMIYLFTNPQKVYRNFRNRKQTKSQFARDDPAFLVLLTFLIFVSSIFVHAIVLNLGFFQFFKFLFYITVIDCIGIGIIVATLFWFVTNRYLRVDKAQDVEWGYCFDIHLNAFFPAFIILHFFQVFLYNGFIRHEGFSSRFLGNTFWLVAASYYIYITFLGYATVEILSRTHVILSALPITLLLYITTLAGGINLTRMTMVFYHDRVV